jgi:hypothetical protein
MKSRPLTVVLAVLMAVTVTVLAEAQETTNLFESAGAKQTNEDFKPAPTKIYTSFGTLEFTGGGYPTEESVRRIYDEMALQRATQAYMDFYPALSVYGIVKGQIRDFGFKTASDVGVYADFMDPTELMLTGNDVTLYAVASLDLKIDGPTVVQIPPGMYGTANDAYFKFLVDFGFVGPDKGEGGKYLFLPPGYDGEVPDGTFAIRSPSYRIWVMMRGFGEIGTGEQAVDYFRKNLKIYPLATGPRPGKYIQVAGMGVNGLPPEDFSAFEMLDEIIQYEPSELFSMEQLGRLASLGIEKGTSFDPDTRMRGILDQGAKQGVAMSRAIVYAYPELDPEINYWPGRQWEKMFAGNTEFTRNGIRDIDARTLWHYQAIVVSPNLISTTPGQGTAYLTAFRDENGIYLDGAKNYRLRVPANMPVKRFWAVTAYDVATRCLLDSDGKITVSSLHNPEVNADGSVNVYFGPEAQKGKKNNSVITDPDEGFFLVFRFYGPTEGYIDKTWVLNDLELIE